MAKKQAASRQTAEKRGTERPAAQRREAVEKQPPSRRNDVIRCENCGEDYAITYKRCPFCDERPGRTGIHGSRVSGGSGARPIQVVELALSLVVIIAALVIVFKYVGPLAFGDRSEGGGSSSSSQSSVGSQSGGDVSGSAEPSGSGDVSVPVEPDVAVTSLTLSKTDITLQPNEESQLLANVAPAEATVAWTSSDPSALTVSQDGVIKNVNSSNEKVRVTITAAAGDKRAECTVFCKPSGAGAPAGTDTPAPPNNGAVSPNTQGTIVNAGDGLNIRSGPGSNYEKVASAPNGATITILEDTGSGWYKIDYGGGKLGYVSSAFVSVKK